MVKIIAHAGADQTPDNTLEYVRHALSSRADAFEVDVRPDDTGRLILSHDSPVGDSPSLEEVFRLMAEHPSMEINCDLKVPGLERTVCAMAAEAGLRERLILSGTVDPAQVPEGAAAIYFNGENVIPNLYGDFRFVTPEPDLRAAELLAEACKRLGISVVNVHYFLATDRFIETLTRAGIRISVWTVNEPEALRRFFSLNLFSVTTRALALALEYRG